MNRDVVERGARGGSIVLIGQVVRVAITLLGTVALGRLLSPTDFGLIAMVAVFTSFGALLRDFGISTAALQARTLTQQQASNLFWVSTLLSATVAVALASSSHLLVALYDEPRLGSIAPILAICIAIDGLQSQVQVQLARSMRYFTLTLTDLVTQALALAVALIAAAAGLGYWALVAQAVLASVLLLATRTIAARWLPSLPRRGQNSRALIRAGSEFGLAQVLTFAANNMDSLAIGARWGATSLGFYNRAFQIYQLPRTATLDPLTQVAIPTINRTTTYGSRRATDILARIQFLLSFFVTWIYLVTAVTADWLVPLLLGDQWASSIRIFQLLAIGGAFSAFGTVSYWTFIVAQQSRQLLYLHLVTKPIVVILIILAVPSGVEAVALAYAIGVAGAWPVNLIWLARTAGQDSWAFFRLGLRVIGAAALSFMLTSSLLAAMGQLNAIGSVALGAALATTVYLSGLLMVPGGATHLRGAIAIARVLIFRK